MRQAMTLPDRLTGGVQVVHEDADLLVLNKPSGLLCVPGRGPDKQDCLSARAQQIWPGALVVHRLDQATSGLVLMARHIDAQRRLSQAFAERQVHKRYQAVVQGLLGAVSSPWSEINLPIAADWERRPLRTIDHTLGKPSLTRWRTVSQDAAANTTRVQLEPVTGRTHQLRVHLAAIGHPILGDALYAAETSKQSRPRLLLHACVISFIHPRHGTVCRLESAQDF